MLWKKNAESLTIGILFNDTAYSVDFDNEQVCNLVNCN